MTDNTLDDDHECKNRKDNNLYKHILNKTNNKINEQE